MKYEITELEQAIENDDYSALDEYPGIMINAYRVSSERGYNLIDFGSTLCLFDYDVEPIAEAFAENGVREFTISSGYSGIAEIIDGFEQCGFKLVGMVGLPDDHKDTGYRPAFKMVIDMSSVFWFTTFPSTVYR